MSGIFDGLAGLGLGDFENMELYEEKKEREEPTEAYQKAEEKDLIYDKSFECPVCDKSFTAKIMKTGKAKLLGTDQDLRAKYEGIDAVKYDVMLCPCCGYAALSKYFNVITPPQAKLIKENISQRVQLHTYNGDIYTYEEAMERYQLALANAVVKRARNSEKAYICLKSAWLLRGYQEELSEAEEDNTKKLAELSAKEENYLMNAFTGFLEARQTEHFPMCGMDEKTIDYLVAVLAVRFKKLDVASRLVSSIIASPSVSTRIKDKARELRDQIVAEIRKSKE